MPRARKVPIKRTRLLSKITANASEGRNSNGAPRASRTSIPRTAVISPRGTNHTIISRSLRDFDFAAQVDLLQNRQKDRTADATKHRAYQKRRHPRKLKCMAAKQCDTGTGEYIADQSQKKAAGEMV